MEDNYIILIISVIAFIASLVKEITKNKNKEKSVTPLPQDVLEEEFPDIEFEPEEFEEFTETPSPQPEPIYKEAVTLVQTPCQTAPMPKRSQSDTKVRINNRTEARRAFIHSEIFNRKY